MIAVEPRHLERRYDVVIAGAGPAGMAAAIGARARGAGKILLVDRERHVQPLEVVHNWRTWRAIDFGYRHPACLWLQRSPDGQLVVVDEYLPTDCTTDEFASGIVEREGTYGLAIKPEASYCDPAGKGLQTAWSDAAS